MNENSTKSASEATGVTDRRQVARAKLADMGQPKTAGRINSMLKLSTGDIVSGRFRSQLYRFMADSIPAVSACLWTWVRLAAAPGKFRIIEAGSDRAVRDGEARLNRMTDSFYHNGVRTGRGIQSFLPDLFSSLFRDGSFGGFLSVRADRSGVDRFIPVDSGDLVIDGSNGRDHLYLEQENGRLNLDRRDFYFIPFDGNQSRPLGRSILQPIPFVAYVEQQLVDDMRRAAHNAGFHRLHVKVSPPERMSGESDSAYVDRINGYFDSTVSMIKSCEVDDNPVTWDNIEIDHIGPNATKGVSGSWFLNHRSMIEEVCAGTNLAPFLLGYSYGATTT